MHLEDEQVQRLLHGEAISPEIRAHLAGCAGCQALIATARVEENQVFGLLAQLDAPRARAATDPLALARRARGVAAPWTRRAAAAVAALALAGAAYAVPGSPVRGWVAQVARWVAGLGSEPSPRPDPSGIAAAPGARFTIAFVAEQAGGSVTVSLTEGAEVVVRRVDGAASFTADADRLTVDNAGAAADYEIELPRGAPWVQVVVGERRVFLKEGPRIVAAVSADRGGRFVLPLTARSP